MPWFRRFPLTEQGWASAWRALSGLDAESAAAACSLATFSTGRSAPLTSVIDCVLVGTARNRLNSSSGEAVVSRKDTEHANDDTGQQRS